MDTPLELAATSGRDAPHGIDWRCSGDAPIAVTSTTLPATLTRSDSARCNRLTGREQRVESGHLGRRNFENGAVLKQDAVDVGQAAREAAFECDPTQPAVRRFARPETVGPHGRVQNQSPTYRSRR